jgi:hypothetical protein
MVELPNNFCFNDIEKTKALLNKDIEKKAQKEELRQHKNSREGEIVSYQNKLATLQTCINLL